MSIRLELFSCSGGMAEGFRRAGVTFDMAVDFAADHCDSYERNLGHRPICMDARDLLRMVELGWRVDVDLFVADPPCTPWSRAGKRQGTDDERDMLGDTCALIAALRPRRYLIGNVPGLDDSNNWHVVQDAIGGLAQLGYCVRDFAALDAADYGVPQRRVRPFWFGHLEGDCLRWPAPTHSDPKRLATATLPGFEPLAPWVTCRQALGHLTGEDLGRPVRMRRRAQNGKQHGSVADRPARVVGTSNLSDGNVLTYAPNHPPSYIDEPAMTVRAGCGGGATRALQLTNRHDSPVHTSELDAPARAITTQCRAPGHATTLVLEPVESSAGKRKDNRVPQNERTLAADAPATTILAREDRVGHGITLEWPWDRPSTTVQADERLAPPGHHDEKWDGGLMSGPNAVLLSERAAAILQGFPETWAFTGETKKARWSQIGQAMPPALAAAVARAVVEQDEAARRMPENCNERHHERACLCEVTPCPCACHKLDDVESARVA